VTPFHLARLNLFRRALSTWISILGIAVAVAASGILLKIYLLSHSRFATLANEGQSVVGAKAGGIEILLGSLNLEGPYPGFLPYNLYQSIHDQQTVQFEDGAKSTPSYVRAVIPFLYFADFGDFRVIGTTPEFLKRPFASDSPELAQGKWVGAGDEVVVGAQVATAGALTVGSDIRVRTAIGSVPQGFSMRVTGILAPTGKIWDYALFSSLENAQTRLAQVDLRGRSIWGSKILSYFLI
jgi:putative ABC transport system permease protein